MGMAATQRGQQEEGKHIKAPAQAGRGQPALVAV